MIVYLCDHLLEKTIMQQLQTNQPVVFSVLFMVWKKAFRRVFESKLWVLWQVLKFYGEM